MTRRLRCVLVLALLGLLQFVAPAASFAEDEVLFWNRVAVRAMQVNTPAGPGGVPAAVPPVPGALQPRVLAIVHIAMFDALNGIERRYEPVHVDAQAPRGTSRRAAVVQAAYTALVGLFPRQAELGNFEADLGTSLAGLGPESANENSESIGRGRAWGATVAAQILAWAATDRVFPLTTYPGKPSPGPGDWRPTPRPNPTPPPAELPGLPGQFLSLASARPFVLPDPPLAFRAVGPVSLTSAVYTQDLNDIKAVGARASATRTADQTQSALFWAGAAASAWNRLAASAAEQRNTTLSQNARLFAILNMAAHDALIVAWDAKYHFDFWRPITAIRLADTDGNPNTAPQTDWVPLIATPAYPDYYSGHQSISGPSAAILTAYFGDSMPVETTSEALPGVTRSWANFEAARQDAMMARVWGGLHFLFTMTDTRDNASAIGLYVLEHAAQPLNGQRVGQLSK
jgi:hypothetical protein